MVKNIFSISLFFISVISIATTKAQKNNPEINQLADCQRLVRTGKTQAEKDELQRNYWILLGIVSDLNDYRQAFLQKGNLIDLFPTAYYHTTYAEMQNLLNLQFTYPIETMKQMIAFYDDYKLNRIEWDENVSFNIESHWKEHFSYAESIGSVRACTYAGFVLSTAITAHVQYDLPRAIKYSYDNRYNKSILPNDPKYLLDFSKANDLFANTKEKTIKDIGKAITICSESILSSILNWKEGAIPDALNGAYDEYNTLCNKLGFKKILTDNDVKYLRHEAWQKAFAGKPFIDVNGDVLSEQNFTDHRSLITIGQNLCPSSTAIKFTYYPFKINPEYVTHSTDNAFKWYTWGKAPGDLNTAAMDMFVNDNDFEFHTLAHELDSLANGVWQGSVQVAVIDLNNNGICGLSVQLGASIPNQESFPLLICEDGYLKSYYIDRHKGEKELKPADIVDSIKPNTFFTGIKDSTIKYFRYNISNDTSVPYSNKPVGGKTPSDLGKLLLQALKTNNKDLWLACIHPDAEPRMASMIIDAFEYFRNGLIENGVEDWSLIEFSRTTFIQNQGSLYPPEQDGNKIVYYLSVEFYNNKREFLGEFSLGGAETYKDGNWFIRTPGNRDLKYGRNIFK